MSWPDTFLASSRLWALLAAAAVALAYALLAVQRRNYTVRFTNLPLLDKVAPRRPGWRRHLTAGVFLVAIIAVALAWAQPAEDTEVPKERATVVLAVDTSLSMEARDIAPNRLDAAKEAALGFVEELPEEINVGVVSFDGIARIRVTPTTDRTVVQRAIETMELGPATAIGEAIFASLDAIATAPVVDLDSEDVPASIIVLTDGKTTVGRPDADGADAAAEAGVPVSPIAFGTDRGTITLDGRVQPVPVEIPTLQMIADTTAGEFFRAESLDELSRIYDDIGSSIGFDTELHEVTDRFVGYAVVALLTSAALSLLWFQRIP